jgi:HK97 family phage major capsid protein
MNQMFKGNDTWKSKAVTLYQVEDDTVRDFQNRFFLNTLGVANPSGTASGSGSKLFNTSFVTTLEEARLAYGGMNAVADIMTTNSGEKIVWPTIDDTGNPGTVVAESAAVSTVEPTFSEVTWGAYKLTSGRIKITRELVEDNQTNLLSRIATLLGQRLGRVENTLFTNGTGSSQPTGLMTVVPTGTTGSLPTGIIFDELIDLEHSIDPSRRSSMCSYMLADNTFKLIRKLKDGNSNYLYQATANSGAPSTLNNYRYTINQDMPAVAASAKSIVFGDMKAFKIRRVRGMRLVVTDELYSETDEIGFFAWVRVDSNLLDAGDNPIACFAHAAA